MFWFKRKEKEALDAAVRAAARPATALKVNRRAPEGFVFPPTSTHFGGDPYAEAGESWPMYGDGKKPYDFVCQVNLSDCADAPDVPFDLFTVFICWDVMESDDFDFERVCLVKPYRGPSPAKFVRLSRPEPYGKESYKVSACPVEFERMLTYPWRMDDHPGIRGAASAFRNPLAAYQASLNRLGYRYQFASRVGGFPTWVHDNTLEREGLLFLAQIDYEPKANNCIGDAAPIFIAVTTEGPLRIEVDATQSF